MRKDETMTHDKSALQQASDKLRDILRLHVDGKPIMREIAARIVAREDEKQKTRDASIVEHYARKS